MQDDIRIPITGQLMGQCGKMHGTGPAFTVPGL